MKRIVLPTRKRVALKRLLKAAAVLLVVNHVFLLGLLLRIVLPRDVPRRAGILSQTRRMAHVKNC